MTNDSLSLPAPLRAYHNNPAIKTALLARLDRHIAADELVAGATGAGGRGCAVWCSLDAYDHRLFPKQLGIPAEIARLYDSVFEGLSARDSAQAGRQFGRDMHAAIVPGADLSLVWPKVALALLTDESFGVLRHVQDPRHAQQKTAIEAVADLYRKLIAGNKPADSEWRKARAAAAAAAYAAADAADDAAADDAAAAYAAAAAYTDAAAAAAAAAAYAAADAAAAYARKQFWRSLRDRFLAELAAAPIPSVSP